MSAIRLGSLLAVLLPTLASLAVAEPTKPAEQPTPKTFVYKKTDACEIKADVYGASEQTKPVALFIHGGALIFGSRQDIDPKLRDDLIHAGFVVVSIDYRLAPETKLPAIIDDVRAACRWVRSEGPKLFHADPQRLVVLGSSAGGYLALTTGHRLDPRPSAIVSFWGYGDLAADWLTAPEEAARNQPAVDREEAYRAVASKPIAEVADRAARHQFELYCRQQGSWLKEVSGLDPEKDLNAFKPLSPLRNVGADFAPTLLIHSTQDADVPFDCSKVMAEQLEKRKIRHQLFSVADAGHGFDNVSDAEAKRIREKVVEFLKERMAH